MKHVAGVPHSEGTRITVVAFSRVHAARSATVVEQTRISAVSIVGSPANEYGRLIVRTIRLEEVICVTFRAGPRRRGGLDVGHLCVGTPLQGSRVATVYVLDSPVIGISVVVAVDQIAGADTSLLTNTGSQAAMIAALRHER
jgi:hypothetical protein